MTRRYAIRTVGNARAVHRQWLGIERLESRAMLHSDDCGSDFVADFESEFDLSDSGDFGASLTSGWDDAPFDEPMEHDWQDNSGDHGWWDNGFSDRDFEFDHHLLNNRLVESRPAPPMLSPPMNNRLELPQKIASLATPQRTADAFNSINRVAEPRVAEPRVAEPRVAEPRVAEPRVAEPREFVIQVIVNPSVLNVPAIDKLLNDFHNNLAAAPKAVLSESKISELKDEGLSGAAAPTDGHKSDLATVEQQHNMPQPFGLDGMLSLGTSHAESDASTQREIVDKSLETKLGEKSIPNRERSLSLSETFSLNETVPARSSGLKQTPNERSLSLFGADLSSADSSIAQYHLESNSIREVTPWPQGMLALDIEPTTVANDAPMLASMDPLALVQLFIQAGESPPLMIQSATHSDGLRDDQAASATWQNWLQDPRVSTVASIALGLLAVVTTRRGHCVAFRSAKGVPPLFRGAKDDNKRRHATCCSANKPT